jgi:enoyl-CoA hydratase/carnithine racemase
MTARQFSAAEAREMGLVNRVLPDTEVEVFVMDYAATIAGNAPLTVNAVKAIVSEVTKDESQRDLAHCNELVKKCFNSKDYQEGRAAFMEKRKPVFTGT